MLLTSPANPLLKKVRRAIRRGGLTTDGWAVAESIHLLDEALKSGARIEAVLLSASAEAARETTARLPVGVVREVEPALFEEIASTENTQGVIALIEPRRWSFDDLAARPGLIVILDGVQDPGNAGAIVRSAEAFEAAGVVFGTGSTSPFHPKTLRASAGSLFRLPFVAGLGASAIAEALQGAGRRLYAATAHDGPSIETADWRGAALVIGSEAHGVRPELLAVAELAHIPTSGVESLNAAVATAVILYEARRQSAAAKTSDNGREV